MKNINILVVFAFFIVFSCKKENSFSKKENKPYLSELEGYTFLRIEKTEEGFILFQPCDANIATFKFYKDSIYHNWGQEYNSYGCKLLKKDGDYEIFKTKYKYNGETPETSDSIIKIHILDKNKNIWKINNELYIDNKFKDLIPYVKENCSGDYEFSYDESSHKGENYISEKWFGQYQIVLNEVKDWQEQKNIYLDIKKDSIIYEAAGYQLYQKYLLSIEQEDSNKLKLTYKKIIEGTQSAILDKTKDFGIISFDGKNHYWESLYIDLSFTEGKRETYILKKE